MPARHLLLFLFLSLTITACHSTDNKLKKYYSSNTLLHQELNHSLMQFCSTYKTEITFTKTQFADQHIRADIKTADNTNWTPVFFDTAYQRSDPKASTKLLIIPQKLIEAFDKSIYWGLRSDSTYTFFAYKWDKPKNFIGTSGSSQYGVLLSTIPVVTETPGKQIDKNVYLTSQTAF